MPRVAVVGMGAVCAAGNGVDPIFAALMDGRDGLSPLTVVDAGLKQPPLCAQVDISDIAGAPDRTLALATHAVTQAVAALPALDALSAGLVLATTVAGMPRSERFYERWLRDEAHAGTARDELALHEPAAIAGALCRAFSLRGFHAVSTACSSGVHAVGMAKRLVEAGRFDVCVAAGADALSLLTIRGFASLLLLDPRGCRPFDATRAGTSLGEGAAAMVLTTETLAEWLGGPLAFVAGWGASADGHHMTAPHPQGAGAQRAIAAALADAALPPSAIDLVVAHGTGTPDNDSAEIKALRAVFGELPPFCSMKRAVGHTLGASGVLEAVLAVACLRNGGIPPTAGFGTPDETLGASPAVKQQRPLRHVLKNAFGFGGNNGALVMSRS